MGLNYAWTLGGSAAVATKSPKEPLSPPKLLKKVQGRPGALVSYGGLLRGSHLLQGAQPL